jgi:hypothetical protein
VFFGGFSRKGETPPFRVFDAKMERAFRPCSCVRQWGRVLGECKILGEELRRFLRRGRPPDKARLAESSCWHEEGFPVSLQVVVKPRCRD